MTSEEKNELMMGLFKGANLEHAQINLILEEGATIIYSKDQTNDNKPVNINQNELPTDDEMSVAIQKTVHDGMWWSNRAWGVVYRVYQIMGYCGGYSDFINVAEKWNVKTGFLLNYDAVQKPVTSGKFDNRPDMWEKQGAPDAAAILGEALLKYLEKSTMDEENSG